jgi:hypothetical protein
MAAAKDRPIQLHEFIRRPMDGLSGADFFTVA